MLRGKSKSRSSPALAAAFNLREFTRQSGKGQPEPPRIFSDVLHDTEKAAATRRRSAELQEAWRQREDEERGIERERARQQKVIMIQEQEKRKAERYKRRYEKEKRELEKTKAQRLEEERIRAEREEARLNEERRKAREKWEAEEAERQRRMPWPCTNCQATGKCPDCQGKGGHMEIFLVSKVNMDSAKNPLEFGRKAQGCPTCGGLVQGIRGEVIEGSGVCTVCNGHGMVWPKYARDRLKIETAGRFGYPRSQRTRAASELASLDAASDEPVSPLSPTSSVSHF